MIAPDTIPPTEPHACIIPPAPAVPTLPDLCRAAVLLLDSYDVARTVALRCATEGSGAVASSAEAGRLMGEVSAALFGVADEIGAAAGDRWYWRAVLAEEGILDADAWSVELAQMAASADDEARTTEPGEVAGG